MTAGRPVLLVTNLVPPDRVASLRALHELEGLEVAVYDGRLHHATRGVEDPGVPFRRVSQRGVHALAASGRYRAVIATSAGRLALPAAYFGARRAGVPFVYWTGIWAQVRTPAHLAAIPLVRHIERHADATIAYGEHVAAYARSHGSRNVHVAPHAVDGELWGAAVSPAEFAAARALAGEPGFLALYVGRAAPGKGVGVLLDAWAAQPEGAALLLAGPGPRELPPLPAGARALGLVPPLELRALYAAADALVVPSVPTRSFREPWALVVNEALSQGTPVIATDSVGAAAGGLVRDGETGLVVGSGDATALARAIGRLRGDPGLRERLGAQGAVAVASYTPRAWAQAASRALANAASGGTSR
jgi:glycosyltransferase involved in cell wall biosynthesis